MRELRLDGADRGGYLRRPIGDVDPQRKRLRHGRHDRFDLCHPPCRSVAADAG
jgi:hypothetical protein